MLLYMNFRDCIRTFWCCVYTNLSFSSTVSALTGGHRCDRCCVHFGYLTHNIRHRSHTCLAVKQNMIITYSITLCKYLVITT